MKTYKVIEQNLGQVIEMTEEDGTIRYVPTVLANADYQAYLNRDNPEYGKPVEL